MVSKLNEIKISYKGRAFNLKANTAEPIIQWLSTFTSKEIVDFIKKFRVVNKKILISNDEAVENKLIKNKDIENKDNLITLECPDCKQINNYKKELFYHDCNEPSVDCIECAESMGLDDNEYPRYKTIYCKKCDTHLRYFKHEIQRNRNRRYIECFDCEIKIDVPDFE